MKIEKILSWLDKEKEKYHFTGNKMEEIEGFSSLSYYQEDTITWVKRQENYDILSGNPVLKLAVVQGGVKVQAKNQIITENSKEVFFGILEQFWGEKKREDKIGSGTVLSEEVVLGEHVTIGNNCSLEGNIVIGNGTVIANNVVISNRVTIGENCKIQSLSVIGEDGFGYYENGNGEKTMVKHFGGVWIGDDVFIGSHVNIARGVIDNTVIESGTKIAPSTHIGHNNHIGKNSTIICSNMFGSVETGEQAYIVSSTVKNQCKIGQKAMVGMGSVVTRDVQEEKVVVGAPAKVIRTR